MTPIKRIRELLNMTQAELAELIGVSQGNVSFYEKGQTVPPVVAGRLIAVGVSKGVAISYDDIYAAGPSAPAKATA